MYLVSKESNRKCRRSSNLKKLTYADRRRTPDKFVSDKLRLTIVSGAKDVFSRKMPWAVTRANYNVIYRHLAPRVYQVIDM